MKKTLMKRQNWILLIAGILITYLGFFLISFITTNYDGMFAFISILTTVLGLVVVILGLAVRFDSPARDPKEA